MFRGRLARIVAAAVLFSGVSLARADAPTADLDAWQAAKLMGTAVNIGMRSTTPRSGRRAGEIRASPGYVQNLAALGFRTVRLPVAWDTLCP
jgi:hypothetical protein